MNGGRQLFKAPDCTKLKCVWCVCVAVQVKLISGRGFKIAGWMKLEDNSASYNGFAFTLRLLEEYNPGDGVQQ